MDATFIGLEKWYIYLVEKAGWILLKMDKHETEEYKDKIKKWLKYAEHKLTSPNLSAEHKKDLNLLHNKVNKLLLQVDTFIMPQSQDQGETVEVTFMELKKWYVHLFEKLGWTVLKMNKQKIMKYQDKIQKWVDMASLKLKSPELSAEHNEDLNIMVTHMKSLLSTIKNIIVPYSYEELEVENKGGMSELLENDNNVILMSSKIYYGLL